MTIDVPDQNGKTIVITGANTGIGFATADVLAQKGARLILAGRSEDTHRAAISKLQAKTANTKLEFLKLDLASFESVRQAAAQLCERVESIDVLINNAGLAGQRGMTKDGFELAFGVNHLGHFLWTLSLLQRPQFFSKPARIVTVASRAQIRIEQLDLNVVRSRTQTRTGYREYANSKLANVMFSKELGIRLKGSGIHTYSLHPGVIASDIWRSVPWPIRPIMTRFMKTVEEGALTTLYCATHDDVAQDTARYYDDCAPGEPHRQVDDDALRNTLWDKSLAWTGAPELAKGSAKNAS